MFLVTLDQAKIHLRVEDSSAYDVDVTEKLEAASEIILDYLKLDVAPTGWDVLPGDSPALAGAPKVVQMAVLLVLGELFKTREAKEVDLVSIGVERLLARRRSPASA